MISYPPIVPVYNGGSNPAALPMTIVGYQPMYSGGSGLAAQPMQYVGGSLVGPQSMQPPQSQYLYYPEPSHRCNR